MSETIYPGTHRSTRLSQDFFFFYMAVACAMVAFLGFAPTYWAPLLTGRLTASPIIHLHASVFFTWSVYLVWQTWLGASERLCTHRRLGLVGVSLVTAMTLVGLGAAVHRMHWAAGIGQADAGKAFAIVPISTVLFFAATFATAVVMARRRDWHQRLMLVAAVSILDAPIARWFIVLLAPSAPSGPPPVAVDLGPAFVALLMLLFATFVDWRRHGRVHTAFVYGALAYATLKIAQVPISETAAWNDIATWFMQFGG